MDDLDHLPLPPDEPNVNPTLESAPLVPPPPEWVRPLVPVPPIAVSLHSAATLGAVPGVSRPPVKKVRLRAVVATAFVGLVGILLSGSAAVYLTYSKLPPPLSQRHAKPVIRVPHPPVPVPVVMKPVAAKAHHKSHSKKARKRAVSPAQHKPWFSNSGQKGA